MLFSMVENRLAKYSDNIEMNEDLIGKGLMRDVQNEVFFTPTAARNHALPCGLAMAWHDGARCRRKFRPCGVAVIINERLTTFGQPVSDTCADSDQRQCEEVTFVPAYVSGRRGVAAERITVVCGISAQHCAARIFCANH